MKSRSISIFAGISCIVLCISSVLAQTTPRPTTNRGSGSGAYSLPPGAPRPAQAAATPAAPAANASQLLTDGLDALKAGRDKDAVTILEQADAAFGRNAKITSSDQELAVHALAIAYSRTANPAKARQHLDRVAAANSKSRDVIMNRAKLDLTAGNLAGQAARNMNTYLGASKTIEEDALNLFGLAIDKLIDGGATTPFAKQMEGNYQTYNVKLEASRPGMKHWGSQWMPVNDFKKLDADRSIAQSNYDSITGQLEAAKQTVAREQAVLDRARQAMVMGQRRNLPSTDNLDAAKLDVQRLTADQSSAKQRLITPNWTVDLALSMPDDGINSSAPAGGGQKGSFANIGEMLAVVPRDVRPAAGMPWTGLGAEIASKRLREQSVGKRLTIAASFLDGKLVNNSEVQVRVQISEGFSAGDLPVRSVTVFCALSPTQNDKAAKFMAGAAVTMSGEVTNVVLKPAGAQFPTAVVAEVTMIGGLLP